MQATKVVWRIEAFIVKPVSTRALRHPIIFENFTDFCSLYGQVSYSRLVSPTFCSLVVSCPSEGTFLFTTSSSVMSSCRESSNSSSLGGSGTPSTSAISTSLRKNATHLRQLLTVENTWHVTYRILVLHSTNLFSREIISDTFRFTVGYHLPLKGKKTKKWRM